MGRRLALATLCALAGAGLYLLAADVVANWLYHPLAGKGYQFWSGIAGCFIGVGILGNFVALLRRHNCHAKGCPRMGRHPVEGTPYVVCDRHHPGVPSGGATHAEIRAAHADAKRGAIKVREGS